MYETLQSVPFIYREKLIVELELLQEQGIIMLVTEVTDHEWCATIMMTSKKDTYHIRMYVDLSTLNRYVIREKFQSPTPLEAVATISCIAAEEARCFTVMDAVAAISSMSIRCRKSHTHNLHYNIRSLQVSYSTIQSFLHSRSL